MQGNYNFGSDSEEEEEGDETFEDSKAAPSSYQLQDIEKVYLPLFI
jgi:hypothetical protein